MYERYSTSEKNGLRFSYSARFDDLYSRQVLCVSVFTTEAVLLPARRYASAGNSDRNVSVCLSVRLSDTRRYCAKTK